MENSLEKNLSQGSDHRSTTDEDHAGEEDVTEKYGHVHDKDNEHNLVEEKKSAAKDNTIIQRRQRAIHSKSLRIRTIIKRKLLFLPSRSGQN